MPRPIFCTIGEREREILCLYARPSPSPLLSLFLCFPPSLPLLFLGLNGNWRFSSIIKEGFSNSRRHGDDSALHPSLDTTRRSWRMRGDRRRPRQSLLLSLFYTHYERKWIHLSRVSILTLFPFPLFYYGFRISIKRDGKVNFANDRSFTCNQRETEREREISL